MEGLQRVVKKLSNDIIYLIKNIGQGTTGRYFFRFPEKRNFPPKQQTSLEGINIQDYTINNFY